MRRADALSSYFALTYDWGPRSAPGGRKIALDALPPQFKQYVYKPMPFT